MKILAINGSPRGEKGFTDIVVTRFLLGAHKAGAETEKLYPAKMKIAACIGCLKCWFETPGICRHKDDMVEIYKLMQHADVFVFASPVYVDNMTSQMKKMFDRLISISEPFFEFEGDRSYHPKVVDRELKAVAISTCGFPEREHFEALSLTFRRICANMRARLLGEFYFPASSMLVSRPQKVEPQLSAVEKAGEELAQTGEISQETIAAANREYVEDCRAFCEEMNEFFHKVRRKRGLE